jgi:VWFA-related protein
MIRPGAAALVLVLTAPAASSAQQALFSAGVSLVRVDVLAADRGKPIANLTARDFEVLDNGASQRIDAVFGEAEALDVLFVFDRSGSVAGETLGRLAEAARAVLDQLEPDDRAGLLVFDHTFSLGAALTTDRNAVRQAINDIGPGGATSLRDTLYVALTLAQNSSRRTMILVFTDGLDSSSWLSTDEVLNLARQSDAVVYAVPFRKPEESLLGDVAEATGGRMVLADSSDRLKRVFLDVLVEMRARYLLTFSPSGVEAPGWHTLTVRLKNRNGRITARSGYFVSPPRTPPRP